MCLTGHFCFVCVLEEVCREWLPFFKLQFSSIILWISMRMAPNSAQAVVKILLNKTKNRQNSFVFYIVYDRNKKHATTTGKHRFHVKLGWKTFWYFSPLFSRLDHFVLMSLEKCFLLQAEFVHWDWVIGRLYSL